MPTENPRITFAVTKDMQDKIESYKYDTRQKNTTQAILSLINSGLAVLNGEDVKPATALPDKYAALDAHGKSLVDLVINAEYERCMASVPSPAKPAEVVTLRRYVSPAAAGAPLYAESEYEEIDFPAEIVPEGTSYAVGISGKSMEPDIPDGCTVFVQRTETAHNGDVIIAWISGEGTVCKRAVVDGDQIVRLASRNRSFADIKGADLDGLRVYGKVLGYAIDR